MGELKHLSSPRKRKQSDSVSSGERKRNSLNLYREYRMQPLRYRGSGKRLAELQDMRRSYKPIV